MSVGKKAPQELAIKVKNQSSSPSLSHYCDFKQLLQGISGEGPLRLADIKEFSGFQIALLNKVHQTKWPTFSLAGNLRIICWMIVLAETTLMCPQDVQPQAYRNAFDIPRRNLLDHLTRMRSNLLQRFQKRIRGQDEGIQILLPTRFTIYHWDLSKELLFALCQTLSTASQWLRWEIIRSTWKWCRLLWEN